MDPNYRFETLAIHAGQPPDAATGAVMTPIYQTSTYQQQAVGQHKGFDYSRTANPTRKALEACLAALEGGTHGLAFASGMAAIDAVLRLLRPGDHVVAVNDLYGGSYRLFERVYAKFGLSFSYAPAQHTSDLLALIRPETRLVWIETPTNPWLNLCDLRGIGEAIRSLPRRPYLCVDNTFATPYLQRPLESGADLVLHSTTKYLGGHSDVVGGALVGNDADLIQQIAFIQNAAGAVPGPMDCFLVLRGIKTLAIRMDRHASNAFQLARFLEDHPVVDQVYYPGSSTHPQHELAKRQMRNGGGMVSFTVRGGPEKATRVAEATRVFALAESLGGVESLIEVPAAMTHLSTSDSPLAVDPSLVRLSVGLEAVEDLRADLDAALTS